jgi:hypothetical protein
LIKLTFRPLDGEATVLVRGTYFRICPDETLRGPDNSIAARYVDGLWQVAHRRHRAFECEGPVYLRVTSADGRRANIGPYDFLKASDGAILSREGCLGIHSLRRGIAIESGLWTEIVFLTAIATDSRGVKAPPRFELS